MLVSVQSINNENYSFVSTNFDIPWKCRYVKYYVSSINTTCNILLSTKDDFINYYEKATKKYYTVNFEDKFTYTLKQIQTQLNHISECKLTWFLNDNKTFSMQAVADIIIEKPSHRAALLTGLFNTKFPLELKKDQVYVIKDFPIINHSKLYLVSLQGNPMYSNIGDQEYTPSIIGNINTLTIDKKPLIYDFEKEGKPLKIKTYTDSLKSLELRLVDFQFEPILLKSPLFVSIKIKPARDADVKEVLAK